MMWNIYLIEINKAHLLMFKIKTKKAASVFILHKKVGNSFNKTLSNVYGYVYITGLVVLLLDSSITYLCIATYP